MDQNLYHTIQGFSYNVRMYFWQKIISELLLIMENILLIDTQQYIDISIHGYTYQSITT